MNRTVSLVGLQMNPVHPLSRGLAGWWVFNEGAGKRVRDGTGQGNFALFTSTNDARLHWWGGPFGMAGKFDGTNDWLTVATAKALAITGDMTISMWINPTTFATTAKHLVSKSNAGVAGPYAYTLAVTTGFPTLYRGDGTTPANVAATVAPPLAAWTHIAVTQLGTAVQHYMNGASTQSGSLSATQSDSGESLYIGNNSAGSLQFTGGLANIRIYSRALSASEIMRLKVEPMGGAKYPALALARPMPRGAPVFRKK